MYCTALIALYIVLHCTGSHWIALDHINYSYYVHQGRELVTDTDQGYCRLHLSQYGRVDDVCMLSPTPLTERNNYVSLYNVHQSYLNNLEERFEQGLLTDLFR